MQRCLGLPMSEVEAAVADAGGDITAAVESLAPSSRPVQPEDGSPSGRSSGAADTSSAAEQSNTGKGSKPTTTAKRQHWGDRKGTSSAQSGASRLSADGPTTCQQQQHAAAGRQQHQKSPEPPSQVAGIWGASNGHHQQQQQQQQQSPAGSGGSQWADGKPAARQPPPPASTSDPSSMWAALQALQPSPAPSSPPAAGGLPSQADLWSSLGIHVQASPPLKPPPVQPLGTPPENGVDSTAPVGSRLFSYTSGADSTSLESSSNLVSWNGSLDGSTTSGAAAQVGGHVAWLLRCSCIQLLMKPLKRAWLLSQQ